MAHELPDQSQTDSKGIEDPKSEDHFFADWPIGPDQDPQIGEIYNLVVGMKITDPSVHDPFYAEVTVSPNLKMESPENWYEELHLSEENRKPEATFPIKVLQPGESYIEVHYYQFNRWITRIDFKFTVPQAVN